MRRIFVFSLLVLLLFPSTNTQVLERSLITLISDFPSLTSTHVDIVVGSEKFNLKILLAGLWKQVKFTASVINRTKIGLKRRKINFCVMIFESENDLLDNFESSHQRSFNVNGFYIVLFTNKSVAVNQSLVLELLWKKSFYNVGILTPSADGSVKLTTFFPFQENKCRKADPTQINTFVEDSWTNQEFFPKKLKNFHNCPIKVGSPPNFLSFIEVKSANGSVDYVGSDAEILRLLADTMNFEMSVNYSSTPNEWGLVFENGSAVGVIDQVVSGDSDMVMGYFLDWERSQALDQSCAYFFQPVVVIVPSGAPFTSLENLFRPFSFVLWLSMTATLSCATICIFYLKLRSSTVRHWFFENDVHNSYYNLLMIIVGGSINTLPKQNFPRILIMTFVLFCLVMRTVYQSQMFNYLQAGDNKKMVKTLQDMDDRGFDFHILVYPGDNFSYAIKYPEK